MSATLQCFVLSRTMERYIVKTFVYPALIRPPPNLHFTDQFAFRPTGSTTAAIITLLHTINTMLSTNPFVQIYALDFSKAFDTVRHSTLLEKLAMMSLPDEVYNWMKSFFDGHSHCTKYGGTMSTLVEILTSVIQGSAIGPASYVVNASDLRPVSAANVMLKFADDTYLLIPGNNCHTSQAELNHVETWAAANNLKLNQAKSLEMLVMAKPRRGQQTQPPPVHPSIRRVTSLVVLGIVMNNRLSADDHVTSTLARCSQSLYALRVLRIHGMSSNALQDVFRSTTLAKILYCCPAWSGLCRAAERDRINSFLQRSKRFKYCSTDTPTIDELFAEADETLFSRVLADRNHVLQPLLPEPTEHTYCLRPRRHDRKLIDKTAYLDKTNFIVRMLYKDSY